MVLRRSPERKEEKERVRLSLLRAALRLAASFGFPSLSLREVSREAGIAPTSFYRHFEDMEQLGLALVHEHAGPLLQELGNAASGSKGSALEAAEGLARAWVRAVDQDPDLVRFLIAERVGGVSQLRVALGAQVEGLIGQLEGVVRRAGKVLRNDCSSRDVAEAIAALAMEGGFRALDTPAAQRVHTLDRTLKQLEMLLPCGEPPAAAPTRRRDGRS
jgi:AcrR family transcriptional regulator